MRPAGPLFAMLQRFALSFSFPPALGAKKAGRSCGGQIFWQACEEAARAAWIYFAMKWGLRLDHGSKRFGRGRLWSP